MICFPTQCREADGTLLKGISTALKTAQTDYENSSTHSAECSTTGTILIFVHFLENNINWLCGTEMIYYVAPAFVLGANCVVV